MAHSRQGDWSLKVYLWLSSKLSQEPLSPIFPIALPPPLYLAQDSLLASQPFKKALLGSFSPMETQLH